MKSGKIAVEDSLSNVRQELAAGGFEIVDMTDENLKYADAVIINGGDKDFMNMSDIVTKAPVIDARGLSAQEVHEELKKRI